MEGLGYPRRFFLSQVFVFLVRSQVNYRASTGFGKEFLHKGDGEWGVGAMQHDLTDAVRWAIDAGVADKEKICIYGGSYGGYACLAGLAFTPDLYSCGVDIVGPSNIKTLLDSIPAYWGPMRNDLLRKIGDVDGDAAFNDAISPLFHIDAIKVKSPPPRAPLPVFPRSSIARSVARRTLMRPRTHHACAKGATAHRPGRERPARQAGGGRPDRVRHARQGHSLRVSASRFDAPSRSQIIYVPVQVRTVP